MNNRNLTQEETKNINGHIKAAISLVPFREVIQEIAELTQEDRSYLLGWIQNTTHEEYTSKYHGNLSPSKFEVGKKFIELFACPHVPEVYLKIMNLDEDFKPKVSNQ